MDAAERAPLKPVEEMTHAERAVYFLGKDHPRFDGCVSHFNDVEKLARLDERRKVRAKTVQLAVLAQAVMNDLEEWGANIVPHLIDTDDNDGEFLREAVRDVLGDWKPSERQLALMRPENFTIERAEALLVLAEEVT